MNQFHCRFAAIIDIMVFINCSDILDREAVTFVSSLSVAVAEI